MSTSATKNIVAFASDYFDQSWPEGERDPNVPPLGKDAATYFRRKLSELGVQMIGNDAVMGEHGWHWNAAIGTDIYNMVVHWAPIGTPPKDAWIVQVNKQVGLFARLLGKKGPPNDVAPLVTVLRRIIEAEATFNDVRWLTLEDFRAVY